MAQRLLIILIIFPIWLTLVILFRKYRQWLLYYLGGAFGLTIILVLLAEYSGIDQVIVNLASFHVSLITKLLFKLNLQLLSGGRFQLLMPSGGSNILQLGIECSAVLESSIIFTLLLFYPLFDAEQKILRIVFALVVTYAINLLRLLIIVLMAYKLGSDYIFIAHAIVARLFFFICELTLYWYVLTSPTVRYIGYAIKKNVPLDQAARVGNSLKLRHTLGQMTVILLLLTATITSFRVTQEWKLAFNKTPSPARPLIYPEETAIEELAQVSPSAQTTETLGDNPEETSLQNNQTQGKVLAATSNDNYCPQNQVLTALDNQQSCKQRPNNIQTFHNLLPNQETKYLLFIDTPVSINVEIVHGSQPIAFDIYINDIFQTLSFVKLDSGSTSASNVFPQNITAQMGDKVEFRFVNKGPNPSDYIINFKANEQKTTDGQ